MGSMHQGGSEKTKLNNWGTKNIGSGGSGHQTGGEKAHLQKGFDESANIRGDNPGYPPRIDLDKD